MKRVVAEALGYCSLGEAQDHSLMGAADAMARVILRPGNYEVRPRADDVVVVCKTTQDAKKFWRGIPNFIGKPGIYGGAKIDAKVDGTDVILSGG